MSDTRRAPGTSWATYLRAARRSKGLTQEGLAELAGVGRQTVIRMEGGGGFESETVKRLARALGLPVDQALAVASGAADADALPPPLPAEFERLLAVYRDLSPSGRALLLERVGWVAEWAEARVASEQTAKPQPRRTG